MWIDTLPVTEPFPSPHGKLILCQVLIRDLMNLQIQKFWKYPNISSLVIFKIVGPCPFSITLTFTPHSPQKNQERPVLTLVTLWMAVGPDMTINLDLRSPTTVTMATQQWAGKASPVSWGMMGSLCGTGHCQHVKVGETYNNCSFTNTMMMKVSCGGNIAYDTLFLKNQSACTNTQWPAFTVQ